MKLFNGRVSAKLINRFNAKTHICYDVVFTIPTTGEYRVDRFLVYAPTNTVSSRRKALEGFLSHYADAFTHDGGSGLGINERSIGSALVESGIRYQ